MRVLAFLFLVVMLSGCALPAPGPTEDTLRNLPTGRLTIAPGDGSGWVVTPTADWKRNPDRPDRADEIHWLGPGRVLIQWAWHGPLGGTNLHIADLDAGTIEPFAFSAAVMGTSPDGKLAVAWRRERNEKYLVETAKWERVYALPEWSAWAWVGEDLLYSLSGKTAVLFNARTGTAIPLTDYAVNPVLLGDGLVCYGSEREQKVACTALDGHSTRVLTPPRTHERVDDPQVWPQPDPQGRRLAFLYARLPGATGSSTPPGQTSGSAAPQQPGQSPAGAMPGTPPLYQWVDTLGLYDSQTGEVRTTPLPRPGILPKGHPPVRWSPDGSRIGVALAHIGRWEKPMTPNGPTEFFLMNVAADKWEKAGQTETAVQVANLARVGNDGTIVYNKSGNEYNSARPGGPEAAWQPGMTVLWRKASGLPRDVIALAGQGKLRFDFPNGVSRTWEWNGTDRAYPAVGPGTRWAAVEPMDEGRLIFLRQR